MFDNKIVKESFLDYKITKITPDFENLLNNILQKHKIKNNEVKKLIIYTTVYASVILKSNNKLSLVINNFQNYNKIIITVNQKLNIKFFINQNETQSPKQINGYITREYENHYFNGVLKPINNAYDLFNDFLKTSEQVSWIMKEDGSLYVNLPKTNINNLIKKINENEFDQKLEFKVSNNCDCKKDNFINKIKKLSHEEIDYLFNEEKEIEITCDWCLKKYFIKKEELNE